VNSPLFKQEEFVSYFSIPLIAKGLVMGTLEIYHRTPLVSNPEWLDYLNMLAGQAAIAIDSAELFNNLQQSNIDISMAYDTTIEGWSKALDLRDEETEGHTLRVTEITLRLAREMGIEEKELIHLRRGALLHDIGKMGIPDSILLKTRFTDGRRMGDYEKAPGLCLRFDLSNFLSSPSLGYSLFPS
jgi:HD-GYP domain-containing protein (c-di-GMP phosphodiesterase class II)